MNLDEKLARYKEENQIRPQEERIQKTIEASKGSFLAAEAERVLPYHSFLYAQFQLIHKRWWLLQAALLALVWALFPLADDMLYAYRSMGVGAALFIILLIPELWKNRSCNCMEIEAAAYYSLRQVYAARLLIFGIVDVVILTLFCGIASASLKLALTDLLAGFLFPMAVTAGICFSVLCSRRMLNEGTAIGMCLIWSGVWWFILLDDRLYTAITLPVWGLLLAGAGAFLAFTAYRAVCRCNQIWEVETVGTENS